jgi:squalene-hopene/tetraprenyl-beta-curcumene cyclase
MFTQRLKSGLEMGGAFLESSRNEDGLWRDFKTLAGLSSDWVTGFVSYALIQAEAKPSLASTLLCLAERQRENGGWAYNRSVPTDCDSTAWVVLALSSDPPSHSAAIDRGIQYIRAHQSMPGGGFCTYSSSDRIEAYIGKKGVASVQGWTQPHTCVTAVALQAVLSQKAQLNDPCVDNALAFLKGNREPSGIWGSYWWSGNAYSTFHALRALTCAGAIPSSEQIESAHELERRFRDFLQATKGSQENAAAFEAAFVLLALLLILDSSNCSAAEKLALRLLDQQNPDGSWPASPILRIPPPLTMSPDRRRNWHGGAGTGIIIPDQCRCFATAAVLWALGAYQSKVEGRTRAG